MAELLPLPSAEIKVLLEKKFATEASPAQEALNRIKKDMWSAEEIVLVC